MRENLLLSAAEQSAQSAAHLLKFFGGQLLRLFDRLIQHAHRIVAGNALHTEVLDFLVAGNDDANVPLLDLDFLSRELLLHLHGLLAQFGQITEFS